jgi:hypothetical protein
VGPRHAPVDLRSRCRAVAAAEHAGAGAREAA